jgi:hypothetical protein
MSPRIALLGPRAAGKSSVGRLLARGLGWQQHSADEHCFGHYRELPEVREAEIVLAREQGDAATSDRSHRRYLERLQAVVEREQGPAIWWRLWERMRLHAALRCLAHAGPVVIDLGAGHARLREHEHQAALEHALARCDLAVWLQPWPDSQRAAECLARRLALSAEVELPALMRACEPSQRPRAVEPIFTGERTSEAVAAELLARVQRLV